MTEYVNSIVGLDKVGLSPSYGSMIALNDGRLMWLWGEGHLDDRPLHANFSSNEGLTWDEPTTLKMEDGDHLKGSFETQLFRLPNMALGLIVTRYGSGLSVNTFHSSRDEGGTWSEGVDINPPGTEMHTNHDNAIVLGNGRILVPAYSMLTSTVLSDKPKLNRRYGEDFITFGRGNLAYGYAYFSDDNGNNWQRSQNETFVSMQTGDAGAFSVEEPAIVELKDGTVMMICRTHLGQFFKSYSMDQGETWCEPQPTGLACYPSPCNIKRLPATGDLLILWNQISRWEIMIGLYRHRLSCAVSKDEGETWQHHKNLESLDDTSYIEAGPPKKLEIGKYRQPVDRSRYHRAPGPLRFNEPTIAFLGDKAIITYGMSTFGEKSIITDTYGLDYDVLMREKGLAPYDRGNRVRVFSTSWFYK